MAQTTTQCPTPSGSSRPDTQMTKPVDTPNGNNALPVPTLPAEPAATLPPAARPVRPLWVLLADASPLSRFQLGSFLHQVGIIVAATASSGDEAEILARVLQPSVAVVVFGLEGLGWAMPRRLKTAAPGVRVVLVTTVHATLDTWYRAAACRCGADACVANTALDELAATIQQLAALAAATGDN